MPKSDADILFSLSSAHITLELKQGLKVGGRCAVTFKTVSGELFREMEKELTGFLSSLQPEFDLSFRAVTDKYGYLWIVLEGGRMKDLLAGDPPDRYDREATALFSESCTRFLVEIDPGECQRFEACFARHGALSPVRIGRTTASRSLEMLAPDGSARIRLSLEELRQAHRGGFQG